MVCAAMLFALLANVTYIQAFDSGSLNADPRNPRTLIARFDHPRGDILTSAGKPIARSVKVDGRYEYRRFYPEPELYAAVTGYVSLYSTTGIEQAQDDELSGSDPKVKVRSMAKDGNTEGADVRLTIDEGAQRAAYESLRATGRRGAVVAINPITGAILALASYPSFDPNVFTTFDAPKLAKADEQLRKDPAQPLLNRALNQNYPPGSTFKVVTASALVADGVQPDKTVNCPAEQNIGGFPFHNAEFHDYGTLSFRDAFAHSCNTTFGAMSVGQLGDGRLGEVAASFGFGAPIMPGVPAVRAEFPDPKDDTDLASAGIGQGRVLASPLNMATVAAAIASGTWQPPRLVPADLVPKGGSAPRKLEANVVKALRSLMPAVVSDGTANAVRFPSGTAGKTGTAEYGSGKEPPAHSWFIGYKGDIAFAVIVEGGGAGAAVAAPVAASFLAGLPVNG